MDDAGSQIQEIVDRETRAWDTQDAELLLSVFHPDMVWPWPKSPSSHDPMERVLEWPLRHPHHTRRGSQSDDRKLVLRTFPRARHPCVSPGITVAPRT